MVAASVINTPGVIAWKLIFYMRLASIYYFLSRLQLVFEGGLYSRKYGRQIMKDEIVNLLN